MAGGGRLRRRVSELRGPGAEELAKLFQPWLELGSDFGAPIRRRCFPPGRTFWLFLGQVLSADGSCRETLRGFQLWLAQDGRAESSASTSGYCQARGRLGLKAIALAHRQLAEKFAQQSEGIGLWCGRRVKVVDGTCLSMPDTPANQRAYPQQRAQKPGCGFPIMRMAAFFCLATGALLDWEKGDYHTAERTLFRRLWRTLKPGEVLLGDRGFGSYAELFYLLRRGVDCVVRKPEANSKQRKVIERISKNDRIVDWLKTGVRPQWVGREQWREVPERMPIREIKLQIARCGWRTKKLTVVTTLLDPKDFPAQAIAELYLRRWRVELYFREIKVVMGMDVLKCKSPAMLEKELAMRVIAYNLVRAVMLQAALKHGPALSTISFKGTVAALRQWAPAFARQNISAAKRQAIYDALLLWLAKDQLPSRPGRSEPRAVKRRPKPYQILNKPRHQFKETPHRGKHKRSLN